MISDQTRTCFFHTVRRSCIQSGPAPERWLGFASQPSLPMGRGHIYICISDIQEYRIPVSGLARFLFAKKARRPQSSTHTGNKRKNHWSRNGPVVEAALWGAAVDTLPRVHVLEDRRMICPSSPRRHTGTNSLPFSIRESYNLFGGFIGPVENPPDHHRPVRVRLLLTYYRPSPLLNIVEESMFRNFGSAECVILCSIVPPWKLWECSPFRLSL